MHKDVKILYEHIFGSLAYCLLNITRTNFSCFILFTFDHTEPLTVCDNRFSDRPVFFTHFTVEVSSLFSAPLIMKTCKKTK